VSKCYWSLQAWEKDKEERDWRAASASNCKYGSVD